MAEEVKQEEKKTEPKNVFSTVLKVLLGLAFLLLGALAIIGWWSSLITLVRGCVGPFLLLAGIITLAIAKE